MYVEPDEIRIAADPVVQHMGQSDLQKLLAETQRKMEAAAKDLDFLEAARYRDEVLQLKERLKGEASGKGAKAQSGPAFRAKVG